MERRVESLFGALASRRGRLHCLAAHTLTS